MSKSSWMMAGGRMGIETDKGGAQRVGSRIHIAGSVLGVPLSVDEVVVERDPPRRKVWQTTGIPRLLVIGAYRMGFEIITTGERSRLRVFIDYSLPARSSSRWLGYLFAGYYARWCTERMVDDAANFFNDIEKIPRTAA
jgi:hypothetical protein